MYLVSPVPWSKRGLGLWTPVSFGDAQIHCQGWTLLTGGIVMCGKECLEFAGI